MFFRNLRETLWACDCEYVNKSIKEPLDRNRCNKSYIHIGAPSRCDHSTVGIENERRSDERDETNREGRHGGGSKGAAEPGRESACRDVWTHARREENRASDPRFLSILGARIDLQPGRGGGSQRTVGRTVRPDSRICGFP